MRFLIAWQNRKKKPQAYFRTVLKTDHGWNKIWKDNRRRVRTEFWEGKDELRKLLWGHPKRSRKETQGHCFTQMKKGQDSMVKWSKNQWEVGSTPGSQILVGWWWERAEDCFLAFPFLPPIKIPVLLFLNTATAWVNNNVHFFSLL